jgi:hypothetical protein
MRCPCCNNESPADASFCEESGGAILQKMWDCNWDWKSRRLHDRFFD